MESKALTIENIYKSNHSKVLNYITYKLGTKNREVAEEITNDVFIRVNKHLSNYRPEDSSLTTWIHAIASNLIIDHFRKKSLEVFSIQEKVDSEGKEMFDHKANVLNPEEVMVNNERGAMVYAAIQSLPENYRRITELFFLEERSHKEIMDELNIPINTIKVQIMRSRAMLKDLLS